MITSVVVTVNKMKPLIHAYCSRKGDRNQYAVVSGFFCFLLDSSESMRYVGGGVLNNPVTRANQSGEGGLRIEPGGRDESFAYAP